MNKGLKFFAMLLTMCFVFSFTTMPTYAAETTAKSEYDFIVIKGNVTEEQYEKLLTNYCAIPLNVREHFQMSEYQIVLTTERLEDTLFAGMGYGAVCAAYAPDLEIPSLVFENNKNGMNAVAHEMGHYVHFNLSWDLFKEWNHLYKDEYDNMPTKYSKTDVFEGFAECYKLFVMNPSRLKECSENLYEYMERASNSLPGESEENL